MDSDLAPFRRLFLAAALAIVAGALLPSAAAATPLAPSPASLDFMQGVVGTSSSPQSVLVANPSAGSGQVVGVSIGGTDPGNFVITGESCAGATLAEGESCQVEIAFAPQSSGAKSAVLELAVEGEPTVAVPLAGIGLTKHVTVPATAGFPTATIGGKTTEQIALKNESEVGVTISDVKIEGADSGDFGIEGPSCTGLIQPAQGCTLTVSFTPSAAGSREALLKVVSDAVPGEQLVALSGEGAAPELSFEPASLDFGLLEVHAGGSRMSLTLRNTGAASVQLNNPQLTGPDTEEFWISGNSCSGMVLAPTQSCWIEVQFNANDEGTFAAGVQIMAGGTSFEAPLSARAERPLVTPSPFPLAFGEIAVGSSRTRELTLTNDGHLPVGFFIAIVSGGDVADFHLIEESCTGHLIEPGESCVAEVRFAPTSAGAKQATMSFFGNGEGGMQVPIEGSAVAPQVSLTPSARDFGAVSAGATGPVQVLQLRNESASPYRVDAATLAGADLGEFAIRADECTEAVLAPGDTCAVAVRFQPESAGAKAATLRLRSVAGVTVARLSGEGIAAVGPATGASQVAAVVRGRVVLQFNARPRAGAGGRVTVGRARCESQRACLVTLSGHAGARWVAARARIQPGASGPLTFALPAQLISSPNVARVTVSLRWRTGRERGGTSRSLGVQT
jgi:Abnormal spindle-like microcephaly-assoc'd, ASPM-SPD-2-Hydin